MKKIKDWNKKQKITGVVVLSVLVLGGGGIALAVHNDNVAKAQAYETYSAMKQMERNAAKIDAERETRRQKEYEITLSEALAKAVKEPSADNIKAVQTAMKNVKSETVVKQTTTSLKAVQSRLDLINQAKKAVADYQADAMNDTKKTTAQQALSKLTSADDKATLTTLQNQVAESTKQADNAKAVATASAKAEAEKVASQQAQAKANEQAKASAKQASGSTSNNSTSNGWTNSNGSNSSGYSNSGNYAKSGASQSGSTSKAGSSSNSNNNSAYNGAYGNSKEAEAKGNQTEREASQQTAPAGWMGY